MPYAIPSGGEFHLDPEGVGRILTSAGMQAVMAEAANAIAADLIGNELVDAVWVDTYTTDRAAAAVTIKVRGGEDAELKYGILSDAALAAGLEYKSRGA